MLVELHNKGGRVCREARKGNIRCPLIIRPNSEDAITGNIAQTFQILNPRWFLPDILNVGLKARRFRRQVFRGLQVEPWRNRPKYPRDLLPWEEGSTQVDLTISFENPPTTIYIENKYQSELSPHVTNSHAGFPADQFIRNIRVGLLECGWFTKGDLVAVPPRDFVCILLSPRKGNEIVRYYRDPKNVMKAIPHSDRLVGLPKSPFVGELTYDELIHVLKRQRPRFTKPEKQVVDHLVEYLEFKLESGTRYDVPMTQPKLITITKPEEVVQNG